MPISGDIFKINQVYELIQEDSWPNDFYVRPDETAGWFAGGDGLNIPGSYSIYSSTTRINYSSDTSISSNRTPLSTRMREIASEGNLNFGWITAGRTSTGAQPAPITQLSSIERMTFNNDTLGSSVRGSLIRNKYNHMYSGNDNYGWIAGGTTPGSPSLSEVERIYYSDDTTQALIRGPLDISRSAAGSVKSFNYGWFIGGNAPGASSKVTRIIFSDDTITGVSRGNLSLSRTFVTSTENTYYGWSAGGTLTLLQRSSVDRLDLYSDTENALVRGSLPRSLAAVASSSNKNYGWFAGGNIDIPSANPAISFVSRLTFSDDTINAVDRGNLNNTRHLFSAMEALM